jgi:hypothetical protein
MRKAIDDVIRHDLVAMTFLGVSIDGGVHVKLKPILEKVQAALGFPGQASKHGIYNISCYQGSGHGLHSAGCALDINAPTNPYLMREEGEALLDAELKEVYERIAQFMIGRASVIPVELTQNNSSTGRRDFLYQQLRGESDAMIRYFDLMVDQTRLKVYLDSGQGASNFARVAWPYLAGVSKAGPPDMNDMNQITKQMQKDWVTLTDKPGRLIVPVAPGPFTPPGPPTSPAAPNDPLQTPAQPPLPPNFFDYPMAPSFPGDRPFAKRRDPSKGYLDFDLILVAALTDNGFIWGAIGFGKGGPAAGGSGDVMHFEVTKLGNQILRDAKESVLENTEPSVIA